MLDRYDLASGLIEAAIEPIDEEVEADEDAVDEADVGEDVEDEDEADEGATEAVASGSDADEDSVGDEEPAPAG
ncbi:MAG: hypothetical protein HC805_06395 [Alkalinema sp. RL_2_19]|nr:hypothetical protein [Alkalinema sp. RL_2_19]